VGKCSPRQEMGNGLHAQNNVILAHRCVSEEDVIIILVPLEPGCEECEVIRLGVVVYDVGSVDFLRIKMFFQKI